MRSFTSRIAQVLTRNRLDLLLLILITLSLSLSWQRQQRDLEQLTARHQALGSKKQAHASWYRKKLQFQAQLIQAPRFTEPGIQRFVVLRKTQVGTEEKVLVKAPAMPWQAPLHPGQRITINGVYLLPPPSGFARYLLRNGFSAYVLAKELHSEDFAESSTESTEVQLLREFAHLPAFEIIAAVVLGARDQLAGDTRELFQELGCSHLLVISGFHIAVVYGVIRSILQFLLSFLPLTFLYVRRVLLVNAAASVGAIGYCLIAGLAMPVTRALVVLLFFVLAELVGRRTAKRRSILLSFLIIEAIWPGAAFEAGCQLTFAAIIGISVFTSAFSIQKQGSRVRRLACAWHNCFLIGLGAWLATGPIVAYWFLQFVPLAAFLNFFVSLPFCLCFVFAGGLAVTARLLDVPGSVFFLEMVLKVCEEFLSLVEALREQLRGSLVGKIELAPSINEGFIWYWVSATALFLLFISWRARENFQSTYFD